MAKRNQQSGSNRFTQRMSIKLAVLFAMILVAFAFLGIRLFIINRDNGDKYKKRVLSQQAYDSVTIPAKRGDIVDRNNTKIAVSQKVYNVCIDSKTLNKDDGIYIESTITALFSTPVTFSYTKDELRSYILANPDSQYRIIAKKQSYETVSEIMNMINNPNMYPDFKGVWLEDTYVRQYPYNSLACDVIGFVQGDNEGAYGLEEFYNSTLVGTNGREYGYLNDDENLERTLSGTPPKHVPKRRRNPRYGRSGTNSKNTCRVRNGRFLICSASSAASQGMPTSPPPITSALSTGAMRTTSSKH